VAHKLLYVVLFRGFWFLLYGELFVLSSGKIIALTATRCLVNSSGGQGFLKPNALEAYWCLVNMSGGLSSPMQLGS